ncbi:MAG TPA: hypothetical protein VFK13_03395 [Gemmatimonadaceae bacterium]|nr:hypothetical protein [Gemmatimonadaceae bacterium]
MKRSQRRPSLVLRALDEARFGPARTLNLRAMAPTVVQAVARAENWLRERQLAGAGEVLIITGRGQGSPSGVSPVREAVVRLLASLRRRGVVADVAHHTAGSFVVRLAPLGALRDAAPRRRERTPPPAVDPAELAALGEDTRDLLRRLARRSLEELGVRDVEPFVAREMVAQFALFSAGTPEGPARERRLRAALTRALGELDER